MSYYKIFNMIADNDETYHVIKYDDGSASICTPIDSFTLNPSKVEELIKALTSEASEHEYDGCTNK